MKKAEELELENEDLRQQLASLQVRTQVYNKVEAEAESYRLAVAKLIGARNAMSAAIKRIRKRKA